MNAPATPPTSATFARVLDRAAVLLKAHWHQKRTVEFTLDGHRYMARVDFDGYFIIKVFCAEEGGEFQGELLCKSLPSDPFAIDTGR